MVKKHILISNVKPSPIEQKVLDKISRTPQAHLANKYYPQLVPFDPSIEKLGNRKILPTMRALIIDAIRRFDIEPIANLPTLHKICLLIPTDPATASRHINALKKEGLVVEYRLGLLRLVYWNDVDFPDSPSLKAKVK